MDGSGERVTRRSVLGALAGAGVCGVLGLGAAAAAGGDVVWEFQTGGDVDSSPTVANGTVFVGSNDDSVYALDAGDGSQRWEFETGARPLGGSVLSSPTVADGTVFVGSRDDSVYALDADDGSQLWEFQTGTDVESSPTVVDGTVFVGSEDARVYAIDAGVEGSGEGSRALLGTLGHHAMGESFDTPDDGGDETEGSPTDDGGSDDGGGDGFGPGFGVGGALAGLGGAGYLLKRRLETDENSEQ